MRLFQELILLFGAGAKTNVGYGIFETADVAAANRTTQSSGNQKKKEKKKQDKKTNPVQDDMPDWKKKLMGFYS